MRSELRLEIIEGGEDMWCVQDDYGHWFGWDAQNGGLSKQQAIILKNAMQDSYQRGRNSFRKDFNDLMVND